MNNQSQSNTSKILTPTPLQISPTTVQVTTNTTEETQKPAQNNNNQTSGYLIGGIAAGTLVVGSIYLLILRVKKSKY